MTEPTTIREHLEASEAYASRRATERPYMSPEERLARIEEHMGAALALLDNADWDYELGGSGNHLLVYDVPNPAPQPPNEH